MLNYTTYSEFDSECRKIAGINDKQLSTAVRQKIINDAIYKVYGLLDGANHPWWNRVITLTVADDLEHLTDENGKTGGVVTALNATAHTVTRSSGTWAAGTLLSILLITKATGVLVGFYQARVTVAGATATYATIGTIIGAETTYSAATHSLFVGCMKKLSATSADLSTQYIKEIVKVFDDQGTGSKERVFRLVKDPTYFGGIWDDPLEVSEVFAYHRGNTIEFSVGSSATAMGVVQAEVVGKPAIYTDATKSNALDCPPDENSTLKDEVVAEFIKASGGTVPEPLQNRLALIEKRVESAMLNRVKAEEQRTTKSN